MKSWDILGYVKPTICFMANIGGQTCSCSLNNLFRDAWCMIGFMHHSMHYLSFVTSINHGAWILRKLEFCLAIEPNFHHN
jgi:hypothetical protein